VVKAMSIEDKSATAIELYAECCKQLDEFYFRLRQGEFPCVKNSRNTVTTTDHVATYHVDMDPSKKQWQLEKYIETTIDSQQGHVAVWHLALSKPGDVPNSVELK
jgi:hypothetical protein